MFLETRPGDLRIKLNVPNNHKSCQHTLSLLDCTLGKWEKTLHSLVLKDNITVL